MESKPKKKPAAKGGAAGPMGPPPQSPEQKLWDQVAFNEWKELPAMRYNDEQRAQIAAKRANAFMDERAKHEGKYDSEKKDSGSKSGGGKNKSTSAKAAQS